MTDKPIIFSAPMVRAILEGRKTQTRRVLKPQLGDIASAFQFVPGKWRFLDHSGVRVHQILTLPFANGDHLWVREAWNITHRQHLAPGEDIERSAEACVAANGGFACACADGVVYQATAAQSHPEYGKALWRPSIHMPRWASRLTLIVEDVRVQRLQEISEEDAEAEGWPKAEDRAKAGIAEIRDAYPIGWYARLWDSLNAKRGYGWDTNPWVVALTFRPIHRNIDALKSEAAE